jgi:hypothetical protein
VSRVVSGNNLPRNLFAFKRKKKKKKKGRRRKKKKVKALTNNFKHKIYKATFAFTFHQNTLKTFKVYLLMIEQRSLRLSSVVESLFKWSIYVTF